MLGRLGAADAIEADLDSRRRLAEPPRQLRHRPHADEPAGREDPDTVARRLDLREQVARQEDRDPLFVGELPEEVENLDDADRVDRGGRFVEDEDLGVLHERIGDAEPLEHAAGVRLGFRVGPVGHPDLPEDLLDSRLGLMAGEAVEPGRVAEVLAPCQPAIEPHAVGQVADPALHRERMPRGIEADDAGFARGRLGEPEQHEDRRRLACPVLAEEAEDLACLDLEIERVDRDEVAVGLRQRARQDRGDGVASRCDPRCLRPLSSPTRARAGCGRSASRGRGHPSADRSGGTPTTRRSRRGR